MNDGKKCMPFHEKQVNREKVSLGQQSQTIFPFPLMWFGNTTN